VDHNAQKVTDLATQFRAALEGELAEMRKQGIHYIIDEFPRGACGEASQLLATYLRDNGCPGFQYFWGIRRGKSHAWIERDGLIVDITADQFKDQPCSVIVTKDRKWHSKFRDAREGTAYFDECDGYATPALRQLYDRVIRRIEL
jgi:hypothetical protein